MDIDIGMNEKVQQFVVYLYEHIRERNIQEIRSMYTLSFYRLSEMYFKDASWPDVKEIAEYVDNDKMFCLLYQELYYRHLYAYSKPDIEKRRESWFSYCSLFDMVLDDGIVMQLPIEWLWDMIDEFINQFQSYQQYKSKIINYKNEESEILQDNENLKVWDIEEVIKYLNELIKESDIINYIEYNEGSTELMKNDGYYFGEEKSNILKILGYFSLIGLLQIYSLIGDYEIAMKSLKVINVHEHRLIFAKKIPSAFISLYYYTAFSYMMMRRFVDAARCINVALLYLPNIKEFNQQGYIEHRQLERKEEKMFYMLSLIMALSPWIQKQYVDDRVVESLMENYADKVQSMRRGSLTVFEELFDASSPNFITSQIIHHNNLIEDKQIYQNQLNIFMDYVKQYLSVQDVLQYMQIYSSISLQHLANQMDMTVTDLKNHLMELKRINLSKQYVSGSDILSGEITYTSDYDFYIETDIQTDIEFLMVKENHYQKSYSQTLLRHIHKFQDIVRDLSQIA